MSNLDMMRARLEWQGGIHQEDRMIKDKWRTLQRVLKFSYQAATVSLAQKWNDYLRVGSVTPEVPIGSAARALINPDKVKQDYDDKILSIDYDHKWVAGDVFYWRGTDTYWLIYLPEITEDAYFRAEIRRCRYKIKFRDEDGNWLYTYAAIRGPVETQVDSIQKNQERVDRPNLSLNILLPRNQKTVKIFDRYGEFIFAGRCWRVEAPDDISMADETALHNTKDDRSLDTRFSSHVLEINAEEDYINRATDDVAAEMKNGLVIEPIDPTPSSGIEGPTFIKPKISEVFSVAEEGGQWKIDKRYPLCIKVLDDKSIKIMWNKATSGQFDLQWIKDDVTLSKTIVVESLF